MFSNRFYYLKISFSIIIIIGACVYSLLTLHFSHPLSEGNNIICKYRKVLEIGNDYFTYVWCGRKTTVFGDVSSTKRGDYISFTASLLSDGNLKLKSFHIHKYRDYAMYVSLPPLIIVFWIVAKKLKWSKGGLTFLEKR